MKHTITTKTDEFCKIDTEFEGSPDEAVQEAKHLMLLVREIRGIPSADFNAILDEYLTTGTITEDPGIMQKMSVEQTAILQAIKRSKKRTNK